MVEVEFVSAPSGGYRIRVRSTLEVNENQSRAHEPGPGDLVGAGVSEKHKTHIPEPAMCGWNTMLKLRFFGMNPSSRHHFRLLVLVLSGFSTSPATARGTRRPPPPAGSSRAGATLAGKKIDVTFVLSERTGVMPSPASPRPRRPRDTSWPGPASAT